MYTRRAFEPSNADDLGRLDPAAIDRVREEAWPDVRDADELHDALLSYGFLTANEIRIGGGNRSWIEWWDELSASGRAHMFVGTGGPELCFATERLGDAQALRDGGAEREVAIRELVRGRLGLSGPITGAALAASLGVQEPEVEQALMALEAEGVVLRGRFTPGGDQDSALEWCDRALLARIHRYTLNRLRAEIEPVSSADFTRFLLEWQRVEPMHRAAGLEGLGAVIEQLDGFEVPAGAWETEVLSARCEAYEPGLLDTLCLTGRVAWGRISNGPARVAGGGPIRTSPIALLMREHMHDWLTGRPPLDRTTLSTYASHVLDMLERRGASFFHELVASSGLLATQVEQALAELAGLGMVTSDGFAGLRTLITPSNKRKPLIAGAVRRTRTVAFGLESSGRWSRLESYADENEGEGDRILTHAWALLRRYGVVFSRLLARESNAPAWRHLLMAYRRLEARGEIRGGRFVAGISGEQFAMPGAVVRLRAIRRTERNGSLVGISAADPLNLTGIVTPGERVPALTGNRILYEDGVPVMALIAGQVKPLGAFDIDRTAALTQSLIRRPLAPALRARLAMSGTPAASVSLTDRGRRRRRSSVENRGE